MTSIGAIKVLDKNKVSHLVCVADGQRTTQEKHYKNDVAKKLSQIGINRDYLLMGTGNANDIINITQLLQQEKLYNLEEIGEKILRITSQIRFKKNDGVNLIIAGKDKQNNFNANGVICSEKQLFPLDSICFMGSGERYVDQYLKGAKDSGKSLFPQDLATAVTLAYDFAKKGSRDLAVNDKLQFGIISENSISTLYHPEIVLGHELDLYVQDMLGISPPVGKNISSEERKKLEEINYSVDQSFLMLYTAFQSDLCDHAYFKLMLTQSADLWADERIELSELELIKDKRQKSKEIVGLAVQALIKKGPEALLGYINDFMERQKEVQKYILP